MKKSIFLAASIFLSLTLCIKSQTITIDSTFTSDAEIFPFDQNDTINGLRISGSVTLNTDTSLVRVVFTDDLYDEYMIWEAYPLIVSQNSFSFENVYDETYCLNQLDPYSIRIEIINASFTLESVYMLEEACNNAESDRYTAKRVMDAKKIDTMNTNIAIYGKNWTAGDNSIVELYYKDKKQIYGEAYNLFGYDYYKEGVFELFWVNEYEECSDFLVNEYDWRYRHDACDSLSCYYENNDSKTGWLTSVKNQNSPQTCGSCWAFSSVGSLEAIFNLYYNEHYDFIFSEQEVVSTCCDECGDCDGGFVGLTLDYILSTGIVTEDCFDYQALSLFCTDTSRCSNPDTVAHLSARKTISKKPDSIRKALIEYGPLAFSFIYGGTGHSVVLVGYFVDPSDNSAIWVLKENAGPLTGENGFIYKKLPMAKVHSVYGILDSVYISEKPIDVSCYDKDNDGYCYWGIGPKPEDCNCEFDLPDCNDNDPWIGPADSTYACTCIKTLSNDTLSITSNTTWADTMLIEKIICIENNAELTIKSLLRFVEGAKIIVKPGSILTIEGGHLTKACPNRWEGIEVWGKPDTTQYYTGVQGKVNMDSATIESANCGILTGKSIYDSYYSGFEGGVILAKNSSFINNATDVNLKPYSNMHPIDTLKELPNACSFKNCKFINNGNEYFGSGIENVHVKLEEVTSILFEGCVFNNIENYGNNSYKRGIGIKSESASYKLREYCVSEDDPCTNPDSCRFEGLRYGIYALEWIPSGSINIENVYFYNNLSGIYLSGIDNAEILQNDFKIRSLSNNNLDTLGGLYLDGCTGYHIEGNNFYTIDSGIISQSVVTFGAYIKNSGTDQNEIYNNTFHDLYYALTAEGVNRNDRDSTGLCILCNTFYNNRNDIIVINGYGRENLGIAPYQGSAEDTINAPANNTFSWSSGQYSDIDNEAEFVTYYHIENQAQKKFEPDKITVETVDPVLNNQYYSQDSSCPSTLSSGVAIEQLRSGFYGAEAEIQSTTSELFSLVDGGDTEELNMDVIMSTPPESNQLREELMSESPYLSDTVMKTAISKENVLPNVMIRDILVANPQSAKANDVLDEIGSRTDPMPDYMMAQILEGRNNSSAKSNMEAKLIRSKNNYTKYLNRIIRYYEDDTNAYSVDSVTYWLDYANTVQSKYKLAFRYYKQGQLNKMDQEISSIPNNFELSPLQQIAHQDYADFFDILYELKSNGKSHRQLDSIQVSKLLDIASRDFLLSGIYARNLLAVNGYTYPDALYKVPLENKSGKIYNMNAPDQLPESYLRLYPNPARDFVIVDYNLGEFENVDRNSLFILFDINGKPILIKQLNVTIDQFVLNTKNLKKGIYLCSVIGGSSKQLSSRLIIQ